MPTTFTPNKGYGYPGHGEQVNNWDAFLNQIFTNVDLNVGGTNVTTASSVTTNIALASGDNGTAQYMQQRVTGTQFNNVVMTFPSTDLGGSFGGFWIISNEMTPNSTSASFTLTALTTSSTNGGVAVAVGERVLVTSDGTNVNFVNHITAAKINTFLGNPSGSLAATAGTTNGSLTDAVWDAMDKRLYFPTTTSLSSASNYVTIAAPPIAQGYLTPVSNTPIITSDVTASTIFYTPYIGSWTTLISSDGSYVFPYQFSQMPISLSALSGPNIYDVLLAYLSSVGAIVGIGPSWSIGGGSVAPGAGSRGIGAGSAQLGKASNGIIVNTNAMTLVNGSTNYAIGAGCGAYAGSLYLPSAATVVCQKSQGQNRIWSIWNQNNRQTIALQVIDPTGSWFNGSNNVGYTNGSSANNAIMFSGLPEETYNILFSQTITPTGGGGAAITGGIGVGINSSNTMSSLRAIVGNNQRGVGTVSAPFVTLPVLPGINAATCLEVGNSASPVQFSGTSFGMLFTVQWRG